MTWFAHQLWVQVTRVPSGCCLFSCPPLVEVMKRSHAQVEPSRAWVSEGLPWAVLLLPLVGCVAGANPQTRISRTTRTWELFVTAGVQRSSWEIPPPDILLLSGLLVFLLTNLRTKWMEQKIGLPQHLSNDKLKITWRLPLKLSTLHA